MNVLKGEKNLNEFDRFSDELSQIRQDAVKIAGKITAQESEIKQITVKIAAKTFKPMLLLVFYLSNLVFLFCP